MNKIKLVIFVLLFGASIINAQQKKYVTYKVKAGETLESIAKENTITPYDILKLNPDIDKTVKVNDIIILPNKEYSTETSLEEVDLSFISDNDIIVDGFLYHEVVYNETLYAIEKKYNVSNAELNKLNHFLLTEGLKQGQVLKIPLPVDLEEIDQKDNDLQPYLVKAKETKYSIARNFGISIETLENLNPKIKEEGLKIDDVVMVPKEKENNDGKYIIHTIKKSETLFGITHQYNVTPEELIELNPQLQQGVKEGLLITIPNKDFKNEYFKDQILEGTSLKVALMLPFKRKRDSLDFKNDRLLQITTDFYFGALIALDSLKEQGLSVEAKVYDTENSTFVSNKHSGKPEFNNYDVVIGPMFMNNIKAVAKNLEGKKALIVSPLSSKDHTSIGNDNLIQEVPTEIHLADDMIAHIKSIYKGEKLLIISDVVEQLNPLASRWVKEIQGLDSIRNVEVIRPEKGYIKPEVFRNNIVEEENTWVIMIGENEVFVTDVVNNLGVLPEKYSITLFSLGLGRTLEKLDNNFLSKVNFHYPSEYYLNYQGNSFQQFKAQYQRRFHAFPSKYAIDGFDVTYDALMRLAYNSDFIHQGQSKRIASKYRFIENTTNNILNTGAFIIKYDGLQLKVVN